MSFSKHSLMLRTSDDKIDIVKNRWIEGSGLIALASNKLLWDTINHEYQEREKEAIEAYIDSSFYELPVLKTLTVPVRAMTIKVYSLYHLHEKDGDVEKWVMDLSQKAYKRYIDFIKNRSTFDVMAFFDYVMKENPEISAAEQHNIILLMIILNGDRLLSTFESPAGKTMIHNLVQNNSVMGTQDEHLKKLKDQEKLNALRVLQKTFGVKIPVQQNVDWFFQEHESYLIKNQLSSSEKKEIISKGNYDSLYEKGLLRYYKPLTGILREHQLNDFNFTGLASISRDEFMSIYVMFQQSVEKRRLKVEEWEMFLTASVIITMMINHYQELSDFYFDAIKKQEELTLQEKNLSTEQKTWEQEKEAFLKREKELETKLAEKDAYIQQLEDKIKTIETTQEEQISLKKEVTALRNYAYNQRAEHPVSNKDVNVVDKVTTLTEKHKSVLFGGHPQLVNKLKDALPSMEYRDVDSLNRDISFIANMEIVFLMTNYFNHPFYYKLMNELEKNPKVKLVYLSGYPNLERTLNEMVELAEA